MYLIFAAPQASSTISRHVRIGDPSLGYEAEAKRKIINVRSLRSLIQKILDQNAPIRGSIISEKYLSM